MAENIFTELYNRVLSLFGQSVQKEENTKDLACNRLRVVLMQDRTNLTPELLERMRKELVELLSKYVEMDKDALELNFEQEGEQMALMLSIPVVRAKNEEEIEAALKEADEKEADSSDEKSSDEKSDDDELQDSDESDEETSDETTDADSEDEQSTENEAEKSDEESASDEEVSQEDDEQSSKEQEVSTEEVKSSDKDSKKKNK